MLPTPRKICLIEDDALMGESLADRFELEGLAFDWHRTGAAALAALRQNNYALVISDIRLPDMDGFQVCRALRHVDKQVPIVTFCLLAVFYMVVTFERANLCVTQGLVGQPGCR